MSDEPPADTSGPETPPATAAPPAPSDVAPAAGAPKPQPESQPESFTAAANNPYGVDARGAAEALRSGRRYLRDNAVTIDRSTIKTLVAGDQYTLFGGQLPTRMSSSVRHDVLSMVRDCYVTVPGYDTMRAAIGEHRLVVLRGLSGTGRSTTAVHLLDEVARDKVSRLELAEDLESIRPTDLQVGRGYVIRLPLSGPGRWPTNTQLDRLRDMLVDRKCYCVLLGENVEKRHDPIGGYTCDYAPPEQEALLRAHILRQVRPHDPADTEVYLVELASTVRLRAAVGPNPRPVDVVRMAELLVAHSRRELTMEQVEEGCAESVHDQVVGWFGDHWAWRSRDDDEVFRLAAFRIALAVLNESTYDVVADEAERLATTMILAAAGKDYVLRTPPFATDRDARLARCRACLVDGRASFADITVEAEVVKFEDDRYPAAVLGYIWDQHHDLRAHIVDWLSDLGRDPRVFVSIRAALAAGLLSAQDFQYGYYKLILPAALDEDDVRARRFAAVALDQAAQSPTARAAVHGFLRHWRQSARFEERWTAAAALGYDLGQGWIDVALDQLRVLGTPDERLRPLDGPSARAEMIDMLNVTSYSLSQLLAFGAVRPVLTRLQAWVRHRRTSVRELANWTVVRLLVMKGYELDQLDMTGGRERRSVRPGLERWPVLLVLMDEDPTLVEPIGDLLRETFRGPRGDVIAGYLGSWIRTAQRDQAALVVLLQMIPHLVGNRADAARLDHVVHRMCHDWADPLRQDVADMVTAAARAEIHEEMRGWSQTA